MRTAPATLTLLLALGSGGPARAECPTPAKYPGEAWASKEAETRTARADAIAALEEYAFTLTAADADRKGVRTDGVVIIKGGELVYERYGRGFGPHNRHVAWSVTKTVSATLVGRAVMLGKLNLDEGICTYVDVKDAEFCRKLKVRHFLEFSSGLQWNEYYEYESNQSSSVLAMLYGEGKKDMVSFMAKQPFRDEPGDTYQYSTGDSTVLATAAQGALKSYGPAWDRKVLYEPLGMRSAVLERDAKGNPAGGMWFFATPRDLARVGYLYLRDGCWDGTRLLPEGWVQQSGQFSRGFLTRPLERDPNEVYGWQWSVNRPVPELDQPLPFPDMPEGSLLARGHWGQYIAVIPQHDLVIVRTGDDRVRADFSINEFFKRAIEVGR